MNQYDDAKTPLWITEIGWAPAEDTTSRSHGGLTAAGD